MTSKVETTEMSIRVALADNDLERAASAILAAYGGELLGFLGARLRSVDAAREAYAAFSEDLWRGLPGFAARSSVRTWVYTLARHAAIRQALAEQRRAQRNLPLSHRGAAPALVASSRHSTAAHLRTENKRRVRALRESLSPDDQTILMLHIDRGLSFRELAVVMEGESMESEELERATVRLRKRFERIKAQLRRLALAEGLFTDPRVGGSE